MQKIFNLKVTQKSLFITLSLLFILVLSAFLVSESNIQNRIIKDGFDHQLSFFQQINNIRKLTNESFRDLLLSNAEYSNDLNRSADTQVNNHTIRIERIKQTISELNLLINSYVANDKESFDQNATSDFLQAKERLFEQGIFPVLVLLENNQPEKVAIHLAKISEPLFLDILKLEDNLIEKQQPEYNKLLDTSFNDINTTDKLIAFCLGISCLLLLLLNSTIRRFFKQFEAVSLRLKHISKGSFDFNIAFDEGDKELAILSSTQHELFKVISSLQLQIEVLTQASYEGDLTRRLVTEAFEGDWLKLVVGLNTILDQSLEPITIQKNAIQKIAEGNLNAHISDEFKGEHKDIRDAINKISETSNLAIIEIESLIKSIQEGDLKCRINHNRFNGDWHIILESSNLILDAVLEPISVKTATLQMMADGKLTAQIRDEFKGEHNTIKNSINRIAGIAESALKEFDDLIVAFEMGDFEKRANADQYLGDWNKIMEGVNRILISVDKTTKEIKSQNWIKTGLTELADHIQADQQLTDLVHQILNYLARYIDAQLGAIYVWDNNEHSLSLAGSYAYELRKNVSNRFLLGEGLVGQAGLEKRLISVNDLPEDYVKISSGLGAMQPKNCLVMPLIYDDQLKGVIELASLNEFDAIALEFIKTAAKNIAIALHTTENKSRTLTLLQQTQEQSMQLQLQQEELQQSNEELEEQAQSLKFNEEKMSTQQEELRLSNQELEVRTQRLEQQRNEITDKNADLERAQINLQNQADELAIASKYKTEFLANMSHELRTPLNSMLLLSRSLADNRDNNLSEKQILAAKTMYQSGEDLLNIINDILDLSKIESGHEEVIFSEIILADLAHSLNSLFNHVAKDKGIAFNVLVDDQLPKAIYSDRQRLGQIIRNLLSNAFKFTSQGNINLKISPPDKTEQFNSQTLQDLANPLTDIISFSVADTGVGIAEDKLQHIWGAFQQANGSISREYGGTGLGLTISRELAKLLNGEIHLSSELNKGSTFTLYLPVVSAQQKSAEAAQSDKSNLSYLRELNNEIVKDTPSLLKRIADDRDNLAEDEGAILIVDDDPIFAQILADLCREQNFKYLASPTAEEALELLNTYNIIGVKLDMQLPVRDGWSVLTRIKERLETQHIPVYVISADERNKRALYYGAVNFLQKPVAIEELRSAYESVNDILEKPIKNILLVEDDDVLRQAVYELLDAGDVSIQAVSNGRSALELILKGNLNLIVLDLGLPDMSGFDLLNRIFEHEHLNIPPVIIFTGRDLTREEYEVLQKYSARVVIKGVRSNERLVEEAALFLHRRVADLPDHTRKMLASVRDSEAVFSNKHILLVDDDIRNIFSLSGILEDRGISVMIAKNGQEALDKLSKNAHIDMVLTDIMMPVMDGYELINKIREQNRYTNLPILALTAKAMKEDRERCLEIGASDYISKPIDVDRLFSLLRIWLYR